MDPDARADFQEAPCLLASVAGRPGWQTQHNDTSGRRVHVCGQVFGSAGRQGGSALLSAVCGAQTLFTFGYSLPLSSVAQRATNGTYQLRVKFSPAIAGLVVNDLVIKARLGCSCQGLGLRV